MNWYLLISSGFAIGILGSFHCIGMCGPIALSLPIHQLNPSAKMLAIWLYNIGRAFTYTVYGLLIGVIGQSLAFFGFQQWLSIVAGILILFLLLSRYTTLLPIKLMPQLPISNHIHHFLAQQLRPSSPHVLSYALIGLLNGLLPCGLVYIALASAIAADNIYGSALFMFAFGLGTIPMMTSVLLVGKYLSASWRIRINKSIPFFMGFMAMLLIVRGMGLGIPYISPKMNMQNGKCAVSCCHKTP